MLPPGLSRDGVSDSLQCDMTAACEKIHLKVLSPAKKAQGKNFHPGNVITRFKHFQRKRLTTGPGEKSMSSIERRESGGDAVGVNLFCIFVFCLSINVHLIYLLT